MIKLLNTYKDKSFFFKGEIDNPEIVRKFDPDDKDINLFYVEENELYMQNNIIYHDDIKMDAGGSIYFEIGDTKYIIDDGYRNLLLRCGYLISNDADKDILIPKTIRQKEVFEALSESIYDSSFYSLQQIKNDIIMSESDKNIIAYITDTGTINIRNMIDNSLILYFTVNGWKFTFSVSYIPKLVKINEDRKINHLPFYPYLKNMDKYGTRYVTIYAQRVEESAVDKEKYRIADEVLQKFIKEMNEYHDDNNYRYKSLDIKKRIINNGNYNI